MTSYELTLEASFDASHLVSNDTYCPDRFHGHTYQVKATFTGDPDPDVAMMVANVRKCQDMLDAIVAEMDLRHLNDMMGSAVTSVSGVANWIMDRLQGHFEMRSVAVTCGHARISATIRR